MRKKDKPTELSNDDKLLAVSRYLGQRFVSDTESGTLTISKLLKYHNLMFSGGFKVLLKSMDNLTDKEIGVEFDGDEIQTYVQELESLGYMVNYKGYDLFEYGLAIKI